MLETAAPAGARLIVERLTTFPQFCALKDEWNALAAEHVRTVFMTHFWLEEWWRAFGAEHQMWVLLAREHGALVGILPLMLSAGPFGARKLQFMGAGEVTPNHLDLIAAPDNRCRILQAVISYLCRCAGEWDVLELDKMPEDSQSVAALRSGLRTHGLRSRAAISATCPYAEFSGSFEEYLRSRGSKTQEGFRYAKRRIVKDFPDTRLGIAQTGEEVQLLMRRLVELHQQRWLRKGYPGAFAGRRSTGFHYAVAQKALQSGNLRLYYLKTGNDIIAVNYCYRLADRTQYYLGGFDERWSRYSPGNIIMLFALEQAILSGARRFDFLQGEEDYKQHWRTQDQRDCAVVAFRPTFRAYLYRSGVWVQEVILYLGTRLVPQKIRRPVWQFYMKQQVKRQELRKVQEP